MFTKSFILALLFATMHAIDQIRVGNTMQKGGKCMLITIDGPSGAGKSTLASKLAKYLNFSYLNSGYFYRSLAYVLKTYYSYDEEKIKNFDVNDVKAVLHSGQLRYEYQFGLVKMFWGSDDITFQLKEPIISTWAALLGHHHDVQEQIHIVERSFVSDHDTVIEGRACGSAIFPNADVKFFLTADQDVRANRLKNDQIKRGNLMLFDEALKQIQYRDEMDETRPVEPLVISVGATILDSTKTGPEELMQQALEVIKGVLKKD